MCLGSFRLLVSVLRHLERIGASRGHRLLELLDNERVHEHHWIHTQVKLPALWVLIGTVMSRATLAKFTFDIRMDVHALVPVLTFREEVALHCRVEVGAIVIREVALGPMLALDLLFIIQVLMLEGGRLLGLERFSCRLLRLHFDWAEACQPLLLLFICSVQVIGLYQVELGVLLLVDFSVFLLHSRLGVL